MDYDSPQDVDMCKIWLYLARLHNPDARIVIYHAGHIKKLRPFINKFHNVELIPLDMSGVLTDDETNGYKAPSQQYMFAIWRRREQLRNKCLFVEADAWILGSLSEWWTKADDKPYISTIEREMRDGHKLINTGTYSYSGGDLITYRKLLEQYRLDGERIVYPVGEQGLVNSLLRRVGYDCTHPDIGFEYNCWAAGCKVDIGDEIVVTSGDKPTTRRMARLGWGWWGKNKRAKIVHAFWLKYWDLPECKQLWDYCLNKANSL